MKVIATYENFNANRYGNPWVGFINPCTGKVDFSKKVGKYTGTYNKGEAGELYVFEPVEGAVYAYGQKDYRGKNSTCNYIKYVNGEFIPVDKTTLIEELQD